MDLGHEQDEVAHIDVVAETVDDEEEVAPVLGRVNSQGGWLGLVLLVFLLHFLQLRLLLGFLFVFLRGLLGLLVLLLLSFFLGFLLLGIFFGFFFLRFFRILSFSSRFGFDRLCLLLGLFGFFLFSPKMIIFMID